MYETFLDSLILLGVVWPLVLVVMLYVKSIRVVVLPLASWAALPALLAALFVTPNLLHLDLPWLLVGAKFGLDTTGQIFLFFSALLWGISGIYAKTYFTNEDQQIRFYRFFLLAMVGNFGLIVAQDIFTFYLFFTLMSFASYGLVVFKGDGEAFHAGMVYIVLVVIGEIILFSAFLMLAQTSEATTFEAIRAGFLDHSKRDLILFLILSGFGIKAGVIGLHVWLPLAHPVAPTPASAVLSGVMIKAGLLGWLRLLPLGESTLLDWGVGVIILGLIAQLYGVGVGLTQRNPKTLLAYSSISQMGILTMLIGLGMSVPEAWEIILPGITFFALHHSLSKGALFLGVGILGSNNKFQRYGVWFALWIPALALAGVPLSSGMIAKHLAKSYCVYAPAPWDLVLELFLFVGAVNTALLMLRLLYLVRPTTAPFGVKAKFTLVFPWIVLLLTIVAVPFLFKSSFEEMEHLKILGSVLPLLLGIILSIVVYKTRIFQHVKLIPAGDILVLYERSINFLWSSGKWFNAILTLSSHAKYHSEMKVAEFTDIAIAKIKQIEHKFTYWEVSIFLFVLIISITILLASVFFLLGVH